MFCQWAWKNKINLITEGYLKNSGADKRWTWSRIVWLGELWLLQDWMQYLQPLKMKNLTAAPPSLHTGMGSEVVILYLGEIVVPWQGQGISTLLISGLLIGFMCFSNWAQFDLGIGNLDTKILFWSAEACNTYKRVHIWINWQFTEMSSINKNTLRQVAMKPSVLELKIVSFTIWSHRITFWSTEGFRWLFLSGELLFEVSGYKCSQIITQSMMGFILLEWKYLTP